MGEDICGNERFKGNDGDVGLSYALQHFKSEKIAGQQSWWVSDI
jgi:hypothetical protein